MSNLWFSYLNYLGLIAIPFPLLIHDRLQFILSLKSNNLNSAQKEFYGKTLDDIYNALFDKIDPVLNDLSYTSSDTKIN